MWCLALINSEVKLFKFELSESEWRVPGDRGRSPTGKVHILVQLPHEEGLAPPDLRDLGDLGLAPPDLRLSEALTGPSGGDGQDDAQQQSPEAEQVSVDDDDDSDDDDDDDSKCAPSLTLGSGCIYFDEWH